MTLEAVLAVVGVIATVIGVAAFMDRLSAGGRPPVSRPPVRSPSRPNQQLRIERIVVRSGESGGAVHTLLRPLLLEIVEARLARHGVRLDRDPEHARGFLRAETWELVRPECPAPRRDAPGIAPQELAALLDDLEAL